VNIIQHPMGGPKMVSIEPRLVVFAGEGRLQYLTDTQPGSSGSPVFDLEWNLVGLHHSGGWIPEPGGDGSTTWFRNEGILIDRILATLGSA
jgi:V8-like Glu-specific endopeptidase